MWWVTWLACGDPGSGVEASRPPAPAARDPFVRVGPEGLRPTLDATFARCEEGRWLVSADVAGRASAVRAVVLRTEGEPLLVDLELAPQEMPEGSLWERYADELPADVGACDAPRSATILELTDRTGAVVDCVAMGAGAARVVRGDFDDRLAELPRADWSACHVR